MDFSKAIRTKHRTWGRSMLLPFLKSRIDTNINGPQNHGLSGLSPCSSSTPREPGTWVSITQADGSLFAIASASINKRGPGREEGPPRQAGPENIIQRLREFLTWHSDISHSVNFPNWSVNQKLETWLQRKSKAFSFSLLQWLLANFLGWGWDC